MVNTSVQMYIMEEGTAPVASSDFQSQLNGQGEFPIAKQYKFACWADGPTSSADGNIIYWDGLQLRRKQSH